MSTDTAKSDSLNSLANSAQTKRIEAKGITFAYRDVGKADGPPLVLLQRFRGTMDDWDPKLIDRLAAKRRVILFDNVGVGLSSGETPSSIPAMADGAIDFIDALGLKQVDLLGWSMGGIISFATAIAHPDRVRRMIVAASTPAGVPNSPPAPRKVAEVATNPNSGLEGLLYLFFPETPEGRAAGMAHFGHMSTNRRAEPAIPPNKPETFKAQAIAIQGYRQAGGAFPQLTGLKQPVLLANGIHDVMMPASDSFAAAQQLPNASLIIYPAAGHAFLFQYAERFADDIQEFLD
jgi:pimeloyl-ACP methyl ester carboxylesterase